MLQHILVPLDGSPFGEHALPMALTLARKSGATIHLVHVLPPLAAMIGDAPFYVDPDLEDRMRKHERAVHNTYLEQVSRRIREHQTVKLETELLEGDVGAVVAARAEKIGADLIIATTHGRGAIARFWLGSVSDELVRTARVPLLLVHPAKEAADLKGDAPLNRIVVGLDGTPLAEKILPVVTKLARTTSATVQLVRAIKPVLAASYPTLETAALTREVESLLAQVQAVQQQLEQEASAYLEKQAVSLREQGLSVQTRVDVAETPASALLEEAKSAEIVALETHGRGGWTRLLVGSVADNLVREGKVAVLLHHPPA